ncbi:hypothetical protein SUDANB176_06591 [Streptomyces sp. enrichment culture]
MGVNRPCARRGAPVGTAPWTGVWRGGRGRRATGAVDRVCGGQPVLQETVGQVQLPLVWIVTPQLLPLPLGLATSVWLSG